MNQKRILAILLTLVLVCQSNTLSYAADSIEYVVAGNDLITDYGVSTEATGASLVGLWAYIWAKIMNP